MMVDRTSLFNMVQTLQHFCWFLHFPVTKVTDNGFYYMTFCDTKCSCNYRYFGFASALVNKSAISSSEGIHCISIFLFNTSKGIQWKHRWTTCFKDFCSNNLASEIVVLLSSYRIGMRWNLVRNCNKDLSNTIWRHANEAATYSASAEDKATGVCFETSRTRGHHRHRLHSPMWHPNSTQCSFQWMLSHYYFIFISGCFRVEYKNFFFLLFHFSPFWYLQKLQNVYLWRKYKYLIFVFFFFPFSFSIFFNLSTWLMCTLFYSTDLKVHLPLVSKHDLRWQLWHNVTRSSA